MGVRILSKTAAIILCLNFAFVSCVMAAGENAVGGVVHSKKDKRPLGSVSITLAQDESVRDQTRAEDGIYIILAPRSNETIDLLYQKEGFLSKKRRIDNQQKQNKVPIVEMIPVEEIPGLSANELEQLVDEAVRMIKEADRTRNLGADALIKAGYQNLEQLRQNMINNSPEKARIKLRIEQQLKQ